MPKISESLLNISELASKNKASSDAGERVIMAKPAFGGYSISFAGRKDTAEEIFGKSPVAPSEMTKKIWAYVKKHNLSNKK